MSYREFRNNHDVASNSDQLSSFSLSFPPNSRNADSKRLKQLRQSLCSFYWKYRPPSSGSELYTWYCTFSYVNLCSIKSSPRDEDEKIYLSSVLLGSPMKHNTVLIILTPFRYYESALLKIKFCAENTDIFQGITLETSHILYYWYLIWWTHVCLNWRSIWRKNIKGLIFIWF